MYKTSKQELQDFKQGKIYQDIENELNAWLGDIHKEMEGAETHDDFLRLQGNAQAVRNFFQVIDNMIINAGITEVSEDE